MKKLIFIIIICLLLSAIGCQLLNTDNNENSSKSSSSLSSIESSLSSSDTSSSLSLDSTNELAVFGTSKFGTTKFGP